MGDRTAVVIGAGPAGLTAAAELLDKTDIIPVVFETSGDIGGISKTLNYKGNRIDLGGHRFFSKSDKVMEYWLNIFALQGAPARDDIELARKVPLSQKAGAPDPEKTDDVMLLRSRVSRIFFMRKFFDYPVSLNPTTIKNLGLWRIFKMGTSYITASALKRRPERTLEDFLINRFGKELYETFFRDYTQKVWGVPCSQIPPEWGAQRIKGLSVGKAISHAVKNMLARDTSVGQKKTETSLIEQFMYPKLGPGQLWEKLAQTIESKGGQVNLHQRVVGFKYSGRQITEVTVQDEKTGQTRQVAADYFFSSMPVRELVGGLQGDIPPDIRQIAAGLVYRDFITVGLLLSDMKIHNETKIRTINNIVPDNWIYIQERDVKLGRLQIFNNWSPYMVRDKNTIWVGLEYFCNEGDALWNMPRERMSELAADELAKIDIISRKNVLDKVVIRMPKAYPAYFGTYNQFDKVRQYLDGFDNLYLIGRNGQHRYNNQDHSMLTAMAAVENISRGITSKNNIWAVNTEEEYQEQR